MKNVEFIIKKDQLVIRIDLTQEHGTSKSGRSRIIASSEGNVPLCDRNGLRSEILNINLTRKIPRDERDGC